MGAGMNTIQQVQHVNFEKILNMWFVFQNPENIMKAMKGSEYMHSDLVMCHSPATFIPAEPDLCCLEPGYAKKP